MSSNLNHQKSSLWQKIDNKDVLYSTLIEQLPEAIFVINLRGRCFMFNQQALDLLGYTHDEMLGCHFTDLVNDTAKTQNVLKKVMASDEIVRGQDILHHQSGEQIPITFTMQRVQGHDEPTQYIQCVCGRIPVINDNDQQLAQNTINRLTHLMQNLDSAILIENDKRQIELVNQSFCDMFGIPVEPISMVGMDCTNMAEESKRHFVNPAHFVERINVILENRRAVKKDHLELVDGRTLERDYMPIFGEHGYLGHYWKYRDITDSVANTHRQERLKQIDLLQQKILRQFLQEDDADKQLKDLIQHVGQLLDASRVYVFQFRKNERLLDNTHEWCAPDVNPEIDNLKGLPFDELVPSFFPMLSEHNIIQSEDIYKLPDDIQGILEPQGIKSVLWIPIYYQNRIDGFVGFDENRRQRRWLSEEIATARILAESYARAIERQQAQRELIEARDKALRSAQLKSEFMSNMSHEIRTPMTGMIGMLELLEETELDEDQSEFVSDARYSAMRLLNIVNDILDFSKIEAGHVVLEAETVNLSDLLLEVTTTLNSGAKKRNNRLRVDIAENVPRRIIGDAHRLRQILMNLANNAIKFTKDGHIVLRIRQLGRMHHHARIRFEVIDTGIGIDSEKIHQIFESFVQADGSTTRKYGGTGLGLPISKQLIELMGGQIEVKSALGHGSTFGFTLNMPYATTGVLDETFAMKLTNLKVLVMDEEKTGLYVLSQHIRTLGSDATEVNNLEHLAAKLHEYALKSQPFDIVLVRLRGELAIYSEFLQVLRQDTKHGFKKIIGVLDEKDTQAFDDGSIFDSVLSHPLRQSDLYNLIAGTVLENTEEDSVVTVQPAHVQSNIRILLAEDYHLNQKTVKKALKPEGYHLDIVENGQQALDRLASHAYDLVLLDIQMPVMDGLQAIEKIRNMPSDYQKIPVIAVTASVLQEEVEQYLSMGFNAVVAKPFSLEYLRSVIREKLDHTTAL